MVEAGDVGKYEVPQEQHHCRASAGRWLTHGSSSSPGDVRTAGARPSVPQHAAAAYGRRTVRRRVKPQLRALTETSACAEIGRSVFWTPSVVPDPHTGSLRRWARCWLLQYIPPHRAGTQLAVWMNRVALTSTLRTSLSFTRFPTMPACESAPAVSYCHAMLDRILHRCGASSSSSG